MSNSVQGGRPTVATGETVDRKKTSRREVVILGFLEKLSMDTLTRIYRWEVSDLCTCNIFSVFYIGYSTCPIKAFPNTYCSCLLHVFLVVKCNSVISEHKKWLSIIVHKNKCGFLEAWSIELLNRVALTIDKGPWVVPHNLKGGTKFGFRLDL